MSRTIPGTSQAALPREADEIGRLIAKGNSKSAVEAAKLLHKRVGTPASEALLVDAYGARVRSMLEHRMTVEAEALVAMVHQRYPGSAGRLDALRGVMTAAGAGLGGILAPLADPAASPEARAAAENAIRTDLADPAALARSTALPAGHPLRIAADALSKAFEAVTSGPVEDAALALPEISRRSPLAAWKPLLRAIACFYRRDDAGCEEHLRAIDAEAAPARLVPCLRAMMAGDARKVAGPLAGGPAADALAARVCGNLEGLRGTLKALDQAFQGGPKKRTLDLIRDAVALAQRECPEILPALRRQISVRALMADLAPNGVISAMGGPPKTDARYHLAQARAMETNEQPLMACHLWEVFRQRAISERWFPARGPEAATVYAHMAELAGSIDPEDLEDEYRTSRDILRQSMTEGFDPLDPEMPYLHAGWLFEQACAMDPTAETFLQWTGWAEEHGKPADAEGAAEAWKKALPQDPRPLLRLMRYAEDRDALKKALGYLRQAEALDGVSSEVRRARLRLLLLGAIRHLKQRKPHLAVPELAELETLPQARENDRPAFLAALRHVYWLLAGDGDQSLAAGVEAQKLLGSRLAGALALSGVGAVCGLRLGVDKVESGWIEAVPRVVAMGDDLGFRFKMPEETKAEVLRELDRLGSPDPTALERLGAAALSQGWKEVAYEVSALGLTLRGASQGRFLLMRFGSLSGFVYERREDCLLAAFALAKLQNDSALTAAVLGLWRRESIAGSMGMEPRQMSQRQIKSVIDREVRGTWPGSVPGDFNDFDLPFPRRRGRKPRKPRPPAAEPDWLF